MTNSQHIKIGFIKSAAKAGDRVTVYFPNGKSAKFIASNDLTSTKVAVIGDRAFSEDVAQQQLVLTTKVFKSKQNYDGAGKYPYFTVYIFENKLIGIYNNAKKVIGEIDFTKLEKVNLSYFGKFKGTALSTKVGGVQKAIAFDHTGITAIYDLDESDHNYFLSGNVITKNLRLRPYEDPYQDFKINNGAIANPNDALPSSVNQRRWDESPYWIPNNPYGNSQYGLIGVVNLFVDLNNSLFEGVTFGLNQFESNTYVINNNSLGSGAITWIFATSKQVNDYPPFPYPDIDFRYYRTSRTPPHPNVTVETAPPTPANVSLPFDYNLTQDNQKSWQYSYTEDMSTDSNRQLNYTITLSGSSSLSSYCRRDGAYNYEFFTRPLNGNTSGVPGDEEGVILGYTLSLTAFDERGSTRQSSSSIEFSESVVINDYLTKSQKKTRTRSHTRVEVFEATIDAPLDLVGQSFFADKMECQLSSTEAISREKYQVIFNKGDIALYSYQKTDLQKNSSENSDVSGRYEFRVDNSHTFGFDIHSVAGSTPIDTGISSYTVNDTFTSYYCAIREEDPIKINPGFASISFKFEPAQLQKIVNLHLDSQADKFVSMYADFYTVRKQLDYVSTQSESYSDTTPLSTSVTRSPVPLGVLETCDLVDQILVVIVPTSAGYFLCYCQILAVNLGYADNYSSSSFQNIDSLNLEILKLDKIKPFASNKPLVFTLRGCDVFKYFDPNMISFIEKPVTAPRQSDRRFLTATLLPISEKGTQSLCFEIIENDIVFIGIQGGDITDWKTDPDNAYKWTQYFPDKFPRPTVF